MAKKATTQTTASQSPIDAALEKVTNATCDVALIYRESFADQVRFEDFQRWIRTLREIPEDVLQKLVEVRTEGIEAAFHKCCPNHVSLEEFRKRAAAKLQPAKGDSEE